MFEVCGICGCYVAEEDLVSLKNRWNFLACPACAEETRLIELAAGLCDRLFTEMVETGNLAEMQAALDFHGKTCREEIAYAA